MGNLSFGSQRDELEPGDYRAQVTDVQLGERDDFKDPTKKVPALVWSLAIELRDGTWITTTFRSSRTITDLTRQPPPQPHMISGLNRLIRACGFQVPQTTEAVKAFDERSLIGRQFVWRVEIEPETGQKVRKFLAMAAPPPVQAAPEPPAAASPAAQAQAAAEVATVYAPPPSAPAPPAPIYPPPTPYADTVIAVTAPAVDPFANQ